eukprot:5281270-Ditylum_brightwellii.AAC.1
MPLLLEPEPLLGKNITPTELPECADGGSAEAVHSTGVFTRHDAVVSSECMLFLAVKAFGVENI